VTGPGFCQKRPINSGRYETSAPEAHIEKQLRSRITPCPPYNHAYRKNLVVAMSAAGAIGLLAPAEHERESLWKRWCRLPDAASLVLPHARYRSVTWRELERGGRYPMLSGEAASPGGVRRSSERDADEQLLVPLGGLRHATQREENAVPG